MREWKIKIRTLQVYIQSVFALCGCIAYECEHNNRGEGGGSICALHCAFYCRHVYVETWPKLNNSKVGLTNSNDESSLLFCRTV